MVCSEGKPTSPTIIVPTAPATPSTCSSPAQPPPSSGSPPPVVLSPCGACKILRRRCVDNCILAPYFPPTYPLRFTIAHRVFGANNIIKLLQQLPEYQRADAASSMVYEANARLRDPVYGSVGAICELQKRVSELQAELAKTRAELVNMQSQQASLMTLICMKTSSHQEPIFQNQEEEDPDLQVMCDNNNSSLFLLDRDGEHYGPVWETLWA
ncbi:hypothetical protein NMG60_11031956 [Bertholletia excelsa]